MLENREILESILKSAQSGKLLLRPILCKPMNDSLRKLLEDQMQAYDMIEMHAYTLASQRGWDLTGLHPIRQLFTGWVTRFRLRFGCSDSRIAAIVIASGKSGRLAIRKIRRQLTAPNPQIYFLSLKLLDCENAGIRRIQPFL